LSGVNPLTMVAVMIPAKTRVTIPATAPTPAEIARLLAATGWTIRAYRSADPRIPPRRSPLKQDSP
jgi:hypothetical protein